MLNAMVRTWFYGRWIYENKSIASLNSIIYDSTTHLLFLQAYILQVLNHVGFIIDPKRYDITV